MKPKSVISKHKESAIAGKTMKLWFIFRSINFD